MLNNRNRKADQYSIPDSWQEMTLDYYCGLHQR